MGRLSIAILVALACTPYVSTPSSVAGQSARSTSPAAGTFGTLKWRSIGPNRGGRSIAAAGSASRPLEYYFGATGGGLWKTFDGGLTWNPVTDGQIRSSSVGAVAVADSHPNIVFVGMGEVQLRGNVMQGDGVYKSTDSGKTWSHAGLAGTQAIGRIRIHPTSPDIVYVAALGHPFAPNADRGVFRSKDGGTSWQKILFRSNKAGAVDLTFDPNNPQVLYAAIWEVYRTPWSLSSGGPDSGLFKTTDGGDTWTEITRTRGLPKGIVGKIAVSVSRADSNRVYALIEAEDGGVFRSDDAGSTWTKVNEDRDLRQRAFYFSRIHADPKDRDTLFVLNFLFHKSTDGGKTYTLIADPHPDHHDLWIDPANPMRMIVSNDGGAAVTTNGGRTWTKEQYPTAQMYHVATTADFPYQVCGAQQDNGTVCVPSIDAGLHPPDERQGDWYYDAGGNESGYVTPDPSDPNIIYAGGQEAYLTRFDRRTHEARDIQPYPWFYSGQSAGSVPERWQWTFPIVFSPLDPHVLYASSQHLWRTTNEGQSWERISPDLTRADPKTLGDSGGPITRDQNGPEFYGTIFTIAPSFKEHGTIWVGSDDGVVQITRDGGKSWTRITPPDMPDFTRVSLIDASPHDAATAYVAGKRYQLGDRAPYVWKTHDYGRTWTRISRGIAPDDYVHAVREDPARAGLLFAGTEHGVYASFDDGATWQSLSLNLPDTQVSDLVVKDRDLVIATHGRSFYVLDDIEPIRQFTASVATEAVHLFQPPDAVRRLYPAVVDYLLQRPAQKVTAEVIDATGAAVAALKGPSLEAAGPHRLSWNLRVPGATVFAGMILRSANPEVGPFAPPGAYRIRLTVDGRAQERPFVVRKDPRLTGVTDADLQEQFDLALKIRDKTSATNEAVIAIRDVKRQLSDRLAKSADRDLANAGRTLARQLSAIEETLYQVRLESPKDVFNYPVQINNRIAALLRVVESADAKPTAQTHALFAQLSAEIDAILAKLDAVDVSPFNRMLTTLKIEPILPIARRGKSE